MFTNLGEFLTAWYNLPFTSLLIICILLAVLQLIGLDSDSDADADFDAEADVDLDHDLDTETDADTDAEGDADADSEPPADSPAPTLSLLAFLGVGKAPLLVVLLILLGSLGILGWSANALVAALFGNYPAFMLAVT